jgi:outer membrane biosynthesis protein TonB
MISKLAQEELNKKKSMRISIGLHLLLLLIAFFYILPIPYPKPEPYAVQVEFTFQKSSLSKYAKSDAGKARPKTKKVEKVVTTQTKPIEVKKPEIQREKPTPKPIETKPTEPIVTDVVQEESPIEAVEEEIEIETPIPEDIIYEEELEEVPEEVLDEPIEEPVPATETQATEVAEEPGSEVVSNEDGLDEGKPSALEGKDDGTGKANSGNGDGKSSGNDGDEGISNAGAGLGEYDDSGDGVFGRRVIKRNVAGILSSGIATGTTIMKICIDRRGNVKYAEILESSETNRAKKKKLLSAAYGYKYEPDPSAPREQCGKLTIVADIRALKGIN